MTYLGFLALFLGVPIALLLGATWWDSRNGRFHPSRFRNYAPWGVLGLHILLALVYTTPWDNYLVATRVWWYDPSLVTGITLGYVPIEEYTFFVVQPIFTGLWLFFWMRRQRPLPGGQWQNPALRRGAVAVSGILFMAMVAILIGGWQPGNYLALELSWALLPLMVQFAFGADILWRQRRLLAISIIPVTLFLAGADALAINSGTWTINPEKSLQWYLGGVLPIEEFVFFLVTNLMLVFGMVLALAEESRERLENMMGRIPQLQPRKMVESGSELG